MKTDLSNKAATEHQQEEIIVECGDKESYGTHDAKLN